VLRGRTMRSLPQPEGVALVALALRELSAPADHLHGLSMGARAVSDLLMTRDDDVFFEALEDPLVLAESMAPLADTAPLRAEALVHAFPVLRRENEPWMEQFRERWHDVEREMATLVDLGIATGGDGVNALAAIAGNAAAANGG
jgi:hypothetical protein